MSQNKRKTSPARDDAGNSKPAQASGTKAPAAGRHHQVLKATDPKKSNKAIIQAPYNMNLGLFEAYEPGIGRYSLTESELVHGFSDHEKRYESDK